jgi:AcrR family transcriptional regulator
MTMKKNSAAATDQVVVESRIARKRRMKMTDILRSASDVLSERGYAGTSLDEIAERLDLTKATLYHYFDSKEALLTACLESIAEDAKVRMSALVEEEGHTASEQLYRLIREQLILTIADYPHLSELFTHRVEWPAPFVEQVKSMRGGHDRFFRAVLEEGVRSGEFQIEDMNLTRHCINGAINYVPVWCRSADHAALEKVARQITDVLLKLVTAR